MGRTLPSANQAWDEEERAWWRFRRALRREDQEVLDELFAAARRHQAAAAYAGHVRPFETLLLSMIIEIFKRVLRLEAREKRSARKRYE